MTIGRHLSIFKF